MGASHQILDTNILVCLLTNYPEEHVAELAPWIEAVERGEIIWHLPVLVISETIWVLTKSYQYAPSDVVQALKQVVENEDIVTQDIESVRIALDAIEQGLVPIEKFADAYLSAWAKLTGYPVLTRDKHFRQLGGPWIHPKDDPKRS
jgi:predicted nucleic acid-binding protein